MDQKFPASAYPLPLGTKVPGGTVTALTSTAYQVTDAEGVARYVPFTRLHDRRVETPLVTLA